MTTELAKAAPPDPITKMVRDQGEKWQQLLPGKLKQNLDRFMILVVKAIKTTPKLMECDKATLLTSIAESAELGLEPNGALGHGWLVPYKGSAKFIVGYKGFIQLAHRCGNIRMRAQVVYEGDAFEYEEGDQPKLRHVPNLDVEHDDGKILYAYAVARYPDGSSDFCVMSRKEIESIKAKSQSAHSDRSPWNTDFAEMAKKCPIRRLAKYLPLQNEEWAKLMEVDNSDYEQNGFGENHPQVRRTIQLTKETAPATTVEEPPEPGANG